jgi:prepilin-type N-terminal cleavage/methylation domain-containing protein
MVRFIKKQGFTLIELMVVIVIIGVLASLAIPRFSEASSKAKVAEAPRVIASWESAFLAFNAETGRDNPSDDELIFAVPPSKWFKYISSGSVCSATAQKAMGQFKEGTGISSTYSDGEFSHGLVGTLSNSAKAMAMIPNFFDEK